MNKEKIFYHIYPLGFCGTAHQNNYSLEPQETLLKVIDWIPHMKYLGVTSLYLGPLFESKEHGYDTSDYYNVDRRLGTNETLKKLVEVLHQNNIEVILDGVFNHVGRDFFAFQDLLREQKNSHYVSWFDGIDFNKSSPFNDPFGYKTWAGHYNLIKLKLSNKEVSDYLLDVASFWIDEFNIDGIRLDAADTLDFDFMEKLSALTKSKKQNFWLMGEVVHGDYSQWINRGKLDSVTNYECYKGLYSSHNDKNYFEIAHSLKRQFGQNGIYENMGLYNFADNHDVDRVMTSIKNENHLNTLYTLLFTMPGIPSLYYGSEWKLEGNKGTYNDLELRPSLDINEMNSKKNADLIQHLHSVSKIRKETKSLKFGSYKEILVKAEQFIFSREFEGETVFVFLNSSNIETSLKLDLLKNRNCYELLGNLEFYSNNGIFNLAPYSSQIIKVVS